MHAHCDAAFEKKVTRRWCCRLPYLLVFYHYPLYKNCVTRVQHACLTSQFNALTIVHQFFKIPNVFFILTFPRCIHYQNRLHPPYSTSKHCKVLGLIEVEDMQSLQCMTLIVFLRSIFSVLVIFQNL